MAYTGGDRSVMVDLSGLCNKCSLKYLHVKLFFKWKEENKMVQLTLYTITDLKMKLITRFYYEFV